MDRFDRREVVMAACLLVNADTIGTNQRGKPFAPPLAERSQLPLGSGGPAA